MDEGTASSLESPFSFLERNESIFQMTLFLSALPPLSNKETTGTQDCTAAQLYAHVTYTWLDT